MHNYMMTDFTTNFGNVNVVSKGRPILELNIQPIIRAVRTMKDFEENIILRQFLDTPIVTIIPSSIKAYTQSPWNKTSICHSSATNALSCDDKPTGQDDNRPGARTDVLLQGTSKILPLLKVEQSLPMPSARRSSITQSQKYRQALQYRDGNVLASKPQDENQRCLPRQSAQEGLNDFLLQGE
jgi:hypothetical protein